MISAMLEKMLRRLDLLKALVIKTGLEELSIRRKNKDHSDERSLAYDLRASHETRETVRNLIWHMFRKAYETNEAGKDCE